MMKISSIGKCYNDFTALQFSKTVTYRDYTGETYTDHTITLDGEYIMSYLQNFTSRKFFWDDNGVMTDWFTFVKKFENYITNHSDVITNVLTALKAKYNPIHNYSMTEEELSEHSPLYDSETGDLIGGNHKENSGITHRDFTIDGKEIDTIGNKNQDTVSTTGSSSHNTTTYDSQTPRLADSDTNTAGTNSQTGDVIGIIHSQDETVSYKDEKLHSRFGNIGVTTSAQMVEQILKLYKHSLEEILINNFLDLFTWTDGGIDWNEL